MRAAPCCGPWVCDHSMVAARGALSICVRRQLHLHVPGLPMTQPPYFEPELIAVRQRGLDEKWVQARIIENPRLLGLGDLSVKDKERIQPAAGRLDLLLVDPETS